MVLYEITLPKKIDFSYDIDVKWKTNSVEKCEPNVAYKPILYLYPEHKTQIELKFEKEELLTTTYPKYEEKWLFI